MRRLDPDTPQELQPAKVPVVMVFAVGTLAWMVLLLVLGARHLLGHSVSGSVAGAGVAGVLLGVGGMLWGRFRRQRNAADEQPALPAGQVRSAAPASTPTPTPAPAPAPAPARATTTDGAPERPAPARPHSSTDANANANAKDGT